MAIHLCYLRWTKTKSTCKKKAGVEFSRPLRLCNDPVYGISVFETPLSYVVPVTVSHLETAFCGSHFRTQLLVLNWLLPWVMWNTQNAVCKNDFIWIGLGDGIFTLFLFLGENVSLLFQADLELEAALLTAEITLEQPLLAVIDIWVFICECGKMRGAPAHC